MNKSTPIAQLPNNIPTQNQNFVNEQQRQYITQAQQAIGNSPMPQNTQLSADVVNDDDIVVQDILNQIHASSGTEQGNIQNPESSMNHLNHQMMMQHIASQNMPQNLPPGFGQGQQPMYPMSQLGAYGNPYEIATSSGSLDYKSYIVHFADDIKLATIVFLITIVVHFIPADKFIGRYFAIDNVPYNDIILRAILAALFVILIKKLSKI